MKLKEYLRKHPAVFNTFQKVYRLFVPAPPSADFYVTKLIEKTFEGNDSVFFVQVGSNDGLQGDPIHELVDKHKGWTGIFIEPVGFLFQRLKANYNHSKRFIFENVAIALEAGTSTFYYVSNDARAKLGEELPGWYDQVGSFDRSHIVKYLGEKIEPFIVAEQIPCLPLQGVFDRNAVPKIDLIHIDTEGFDYKVLSQVDFARYKPAIVLYEHEHLAPEEKELARDLLKGAGYSLTEYGGDTLAQRN